MISLTVQLLIASLFSSTTTTSVKTPYLKMIDIWYACVITICFMIVIAQVYVNVQIYDGVTRNFFAKLIFVKEIISKNSKTQVEDLRKSENENDESRSKAGFKAARNINNTSRFGIMICFAGFLAIYCLVAAGII